MSSYCKIALIAHVGGEPSQKYLPSGDAITEFSLAHSERRKDGVDGPTSWYRCTAFGKQGEVALAYLHKGSQVYIEGVLNPREYEDKEGKNRISLDVRVRELQLLGNKVDSQGARPPATPAPDATGNDWDDAIPF